MSNNKMIDTQIVHLDFVSSVLFYSSSLKQLKF
jgi:hypothetical protein